MIMTVMDIAACALLASSLADVACPCIEFTIEYSYRTNVHMNLWGSYVHVFILGGHYQKHNNDPGGTIPQERPFLGRTLYFEKNTRFRGECFWGGNY